MGASKRRLLAALALAANAIALRHGPALAQSNESVVLPEISVTNTRLVGGTGGGRRGVASGTEADVGTEPPAETAGPSGIVTGTIITGASSTVITAQEIERSPGQTIQDVLAREPGIQVRSLFGMVNGASTSVDMRGFGAAGTSNTLVLINGRRLNDIDMAGVDFSALPKNSIERIEITRGNSGAVLYGDGAVGGVINIVTKAPIDVPPSARVQAGFGSFNYLEGNLSANTSANTSAGQFGSSVYANAIRSDGYRENNKLRQENAVGDLRWTDGQGTSAYFNLSGDHQHLGLPGGRRVTPTTSELVTDRRGAATPFDFGERQGINATLGVTRELWQGTELIVDGGVRHKNQESAFFNPFGDSGFKADLTSLSITPRLLSQHVVGAAPGKLITGIDVYTSIYDADRSRHLSDPPIHRYDLKQTTVVAYFQETIGVRPDTDIAFGGRVQRNQISARDRFDPNAPGALFAGPQGVPLDDSEFQYAWHMGIEHRVTQHVAFFGRAARSFRVPNVDERVAMSPFGVATSFDLKTQTSHDVEGGIRASAGPLMWQISAYYMGLENELHFSPATFTNTNLDPTRRYGVENIVTWRVSDVLRLKAGLAYTRATFREGPFAGNDVPLVSPWTGSVAVSWDIYRKYLVLDAVARFFSNRRMDNDQRNVQPLIPGKAVLDLRIGGEIDKFFWSASVQNVFNTLYFEYAIASAFDIGFYNAYPLPGRTYLVRAGMRF
ncbi:MAG: TonB-dependent receptor plug domain-containing protein [Rhizobiales bacterium]|nr:TonB-dependent receptor plug domain-containing protein [Hyphomicrobiales bacterium]